MAGQATFSASGGDPSSGLAHASNSTLYRQLALQGKKILAFLRQKGASDALFMGCRGHAGAVDLEDMVTAAVESFEQWASMHEGMSVELHLSGRWFLCCVTPEELTQEQAREWAYEQWERYYSLEPQVREADWLFKQVARPYVRLYCGMPRALQEALLDVAGTYGVRIRAMLPWWATGLQAALSRAPQGEIAADVGLKQVESWAWSEPGLLIQAQAHVKDGRWCLQRLWADVHECGASGSALIRARVMLPSGEPESLLMPMTMQELE